MFTIQIKETNGKIHYVSDVFFLSSDDGNRTIVNTEDGYFRALKIKKKRVVDALLIIVKIAYPMCECSVIKTPKGWFIEHGKN